jgi:hypothetical protein
LGIVHIWMLPLGVGRRRLSQQLGEREDYLK